MSGAYVRATYGVDFKRGDRVNVNHRVGTVVSFPDQYVGVRFDGETAIARCHPTWRIFHACPGCIHGPACRLVPCEVCGKQWHLLGGSMDESFLCSRCQDDL